MQAHSFKHADNENGFMVKLEKSCFEQLNLKSKKRLCALKL